MGVIAGIAIPTTIAVINRQKKNAACKSGDNIVSTAKTFLLAVAAEGNGDDNVTNVMTGTTVTGYSVTAAQLVSAGELEKNPVTAGTLTITLTLSDTSFSVTNDANLTIDNQAVHWDTTKAAFATGAQAVTAA